MRARRAAFVIAVVAAITGCGGKSTATPKKPTLEPSEGKQPPQADETCGGAPMTVKFYDVGQGLAVLVTLPDGQRVLVDTGDSANKAPEGHKRFIDGLTADIGANGKLDLVWITHQHSDHLGGVSAVVANFDVKNYAHNGSDPGTQVAAKALAEAKKEAAITVIDPTNTAVPITAADVTLTAVVPSSWPVKCDKHPNDCSLLLHIRYCKSTVLFTGDAEEKLEEHVTVPQARLLQVGHHGSDTSSSPAFIKAVEPSIAVMSPGQPFEGTNSTYCHPLRKTVETLNAAMGGAGSKTIHAFNGKDYGPSCSASKSNPADWKDLPANDNIYVTARDGAITFTTTGDGKFTAAVEK